MNIFVYKNLNIRKYLNIYNVKVEKVQQMNVQIDFWPKKTNKYLDKLINLSINILIYSNIRILATHWYLASEKKNLET